MLAYAIISVVVAVNIRLKLTGIHPTAQLQVDAV